MWLAIYLSFVFLHNIDNMNLCCKSTWGHVYDDNFTWVINLIPWLHGNIFLASTHDWEIEVVYFQRGQICGISAVRGLSPIWTSLGLGLFPLFPEAWKSKKTKAQIQFCKLPQGKCGSGALPTSVVSRFISSPFWVLGWDLYWRKTD